MLKTKNQNTIYKIEISKLIDGIDETEFEKFKFKDLGYLVLLYRKQGTSDIQWNFHGLITIDELKRKIGVKQYSKFCQGKREFIIQK